MTNTETVTQAYTLVASHASARHTDEGVQISLNNRSQTYVVSVYARMSGIGLRSFNRHTGIKTLAEARKIANQVWVHDEM